MRMKQLNCSLNFGNLRTYWNDLNTAKLYKITELEMLRFKGLGYFLFQVDWIQPKSVPFADA